MSGEVQVGGNEPAHATDAEAAELEAQLAAPAEGEQKPVIANQEAPESAAGEDEDEDDDRVAKNDTELDAAANDTEREAIRARRREERQRRKARRADKVESLERMVGSLAENNRKLAEQVSRLQNSDTSAKMSQLDDAIVEAGNAVEHFKGVMADATAKGDGVTAAQAMDYVLKARDRFTNLTAVKNDAVRSAQRPAAIDPVVQKNAREFAAKNSWYKGPNSNDADSQIMTTLDNAVSREGFSPSSPEYWSELETRAKRYLPHRFAKAEASDNGYTTPDEPRRTPRPSVAGSAPRGTPQGEAFTLSAARVSAMKEAGIWDDPVRRKSLIAEYQRMDKANKR